MSKERDEMINSLKEIVVPKLIALNFKGSFPHFRRTIEEKTNLITFQFDRNGGGFVIELANYEGLQFKNVFGKILPVTKMNAHHLDNRQRIYPNVIEEENGTDSWFRYDQKKFFSFGNPYNKLSKKVLDRIPFMEEYWKFGKE